MVDILRLFCEVDDFYREFLPYWESINKASCLKDGKKHRNRNSSMSMSEVMTIVILFHQSGYRNLKTFYTANVCVYLGKEFPRAVSYTRFLELQQLSMVPLQAFLHSRFGKCSGISFIDSTSISVCDNRRIISNRVFRGIARRGKTSMGWFYGFKVHLVVNDMGEILALRITLGNVDDRKPVRILSKKLFGKLFGDRGYLSAPLFKSLFDKGLELITKIKKNMKNKLMPMFDKLMLRKRALIESIFDQLKNISQIEHTRHRSVINFFVNLFAGLIAYTYQEKKPSLNLREEHLVTFQSTLL